MCLAVFAFQIDPQYPFILAANRDEFYGRPTQKLHRWETQPPIWAGKDLEQGGTWLGISDQGQFAFLTNFRDPSRLIEEPISRGLLVKEALLTDSIEDYLKTISQQAERYNGYNLVVGNAQQLFYYSNISNEILSLEPGLYGLSNHLLDTPWPKVLKVKQELQSILSQPRFSANQLFNIMHDPGRYQDSDLPDTGIGLDGERMLAPIFIQSPNYGTRSTHVVLLGAEQIDCHERLFQAGDEVSRQTQIIALT